MGAQISIRETAPFGETIGQNRLQMSLGIQDRFQKSFLYFLVKDVQMPYLIKGGTRSVNFSVAGEIFTVPINDVVVIVREKVQSGLLLIGNNQSS